ncbi:MAG: hypothetical protein AUH46_00200 [Gemmatimonadetes bacterium 13_1_40CM_70_15]|nr:MAG: hypothetical protein AUH46_00200 [Gemmatimonadetes bacterium 13_1_40CM_70_15]
MAFSYRRALGITVAAVATSTAALAAQAPQAPPAPQVTVGGIVYGQFLYQLKDSLGAGHQNNFSVQRAYINVIGRFAGGVQTRVTADILPAPSAVSPTQTVVRLKYAYAAWTPTGSALSYKLGLLHTPWLDWEEALWDYRMQGTMALDRNGYATAADFGAGIDGKWKDDLVNGQVTVVNGEGYSGGPGDKRKDVQARVSVRVATTDDNSRVGGLRLTGYAGVGKRTGGGDRNRFVGMVSYRSKEFTLAGEFAATKDTVSPAGGGPDATGRVISGFGVYHVPKSGVALIARVDVVDPNTSVSGDRMTRVIGGLSYQVSPNLRVLADVDNLSYETTALNDADTRRSQGLFQMQFTF